MPRNKKHTDHNTGAWGEKLACEAWRKLGLPADIIGGNRKGDVYLWLDKDKTRGFAAQVKTRVLSSSWRRSSSATPWVSFSGTLGNDGLPVILIILPSGHEPVKNTGQFERTKDIFEPFGYLCDGGYLAELKVTKEGCQNFGKPTDTLSIRPDTGGGTEHTMYKQSEGNGQGKLLEDLMKDLSNEMKVEREDVASRGVPSTWRPEHAKWTGACMTLEEARDQIQVPCLQVEQKSINAYRAKINNSDPDHVVKLPVGHSKLDLEVTTKGRVLRVQFKAAYPAADGGFLVQLNCKHNGQVATYHEDEADYVAVTRLAAAPSRTRSGKGPRRVTDIWNIPMGELAERNLVSTTYRVRTGRLTAGQRVPRRNYSRKCFKVYRKKIEKGKKGKKGRKGKKQDWTTNYHETV